MAIQQVAVKAIATPLLIGGASLAGRRWGHHIGGWLVAFPLTSGPVAFFLATDQGTDFAAQAAVGMLAGTISQVAFALAYTVVARSGWLAPFGAGCAAFTVATIALAALPWAALPTFALVIACLVSAYALVGRAESLDGPAVAVAEPPRWDIPVRMSLATVVVVTITALAPFIGAHLTGLLSPFPVFGAVLAVFTHHSHGARGATAVLDGLITGLASPAVFFLVLALALSPLGLASFAVAAAVALMTQFGTMFAIPRVRTEG